MVLTRHTFHDLSTTTSCMNQECMFICPKMCVPLTLFILGPLSLDSALDSVRLRYVRLVLIKKYCIIYIFIF